MFVTPSSLFRLIRPIPKVHWYGTYKYLGRCTFTANTAVHSQIQNYLHLVPFVENALQWRLWRKNHRSTIDNSKTSVLAYSDSQDPNTHFYILQLQFFTDISLMSLEEEFQAQRKAIKDYQDQRKATSPPERTSISLKWESTQFFQC